MQRIVMKEESTQEKNREYGKCQAISEFGGKLFRYAFIPCKILLIN